MRGAIFIGALVAVASGDRPVTAQAARGTIHGTVRDTSDAIVPDATVEVKHLETGVLLSLRTNEDGRFTAPDLRLGAYEVRATVTGFQSVLRSDIVLQVGDQLAVDFALPPGSVQETVTVTTVTPAIQTRSSAVGTVIDTQLLTELPLNGRSFSQLIALAPGATEVPFGAAGGGALFGRQPNYTVSGARPEGQAFLLDGTNIQGFWNRGAGAGALGTTLGVEALAEFQVLTNTYSAQFGGSGAVVNAISRAGTNQVHGSALEYYRNSRMDARHAFDVLGTQPFAKHQFGGSLGGPIRRNRLFYFVNYEGIDQQQTETRIVSVPDMDARNGIVDGEPIGVHPAIRPLLDLYPLATSSVGGGVGQTAQVAASDGHEHYVLSRLDYALAPAHAAFVRHVSDIAGWSDPWAGSPIPKWGARSTTNNQYLTAEERTIASASLINQARFGFVRTREQSRTTGDTPALNFFPGEQRQNGSVQVTSLTTIGASIVLPVALASDRYTIANDVYWHRGRHSLKLGGAIEWTHTTMDVPFLAGGVWVFTSLRSLLANVPITAVGALPGGDDARRTLRETAYVAYLHDDWHVGPRLTVNLGLRYNPLAVPSIAGTAGATTLKRPPQTPFEPVDRAFATNPSLTNLDPRAGFAYVPFADHKTSIRGGFGVFHNPIGARALLPYYVNNPPFLTGQQFFFPLTPLPSTFPVPFAAGGLPLLSVNQGVDYNERHTPFLQQWNINVQREILEGTGVTIAYVGSRGVNQLRQRDVNPVTPRTLGNGAVVFGVANPFAPGIVSNPAVNPAFSRLTINYADSWSAYHSLQASLRRRLERGVQAQVSYTLSRCTDLTSGSFGGEGSTPSTNPYDPEYDRGPCYYDRTHVLTASGIWELPFAGNRALEGWQIAAIVRAASGRPFTPAIGFSQSGLQGQAPERPNLAPGRTLADAYTGNPRQWFDPTAFVLPAAGTLGTVERHALRAPAQHSVDISVARTIDLGRADVQVRLDVFNALNHVNYGLPNANIFIQTPNGGGVYSPTAGQITQAGPPRQLQLSAKVVF